jgi:hypothetical protein
VPFAFFLVSSLQKKVEANWAAFAYIPGILLALRYYERLIRSTRWGKYFWRIHWGYSGLACGLILVHIYVPFLGLSSDRTDQFFGWDQLGEAAAQLVREHPDILLAANRHQMASEIEFYSGEQVVCLNIGNRPNQYDLWQDTAALMQSDLFFFDHDRQLSQAIHDHFQQITLVKEIPLRRGQKSLRSVFVYRLSNS